MTDKTLCTRQGLVKTNAMCKGSSRSEKAGCALDLVSNIFSVEVLALFFYQQFQFRTALKWDPQIYFYIGSRNAPNRCCYAVCVSRRLSCSSWFLLDPSSSYHLSAGDAIYSRYGDPVLELQYRLLVDWFMASGWSCRKYLIHRRRVLLLHKCML